MFKAKYKDNTITVLEATNLNGPFFCDTDGCDAEVILKSVDGIKSPYFSSLHKFDHSDKCIYRYGNHSCIENENLEKSSLEDILNSSQIQRKSSAGSFPKKNSKQKKTGAEYIRTPKKLLEYCLSNNYDCEYQEGLKIKDFFVDSHTIISENYMAGFQGIKLVYGRMFFLNYKTKELEMYVPFRGSYIPFYANLTPALFYKLKKYFIDTYDSHISKLPVAVIGNWTMKTNAIGNLCPYSDISTQKNIVYRFI